MSDNPTYETCRFVLELELPSTPDSPIDMEGVTEEIKELFGDDAIPQAKSVDVYPICDGPCFGVLTPDMLDDLSDETLRMMVDTIEEATGEGPESYTRESMHTFLKNGMLDAQEERQKTLH